VPDDPPIVYTTTRTKPLAEVLASDVPRGLSPDDVATDGAGAPEPEDFTEHRNVERLRFVGTEETLLLHRETHPDPEPEAESIDIGLQPVPPRLIPLQANPTLHMSDIRSRRFNLLERGSSLADVRDISDEFEAALDNIAENPPPFLTEEIRGFEDAEVIHLGHPSEPVALNPDGEVRFRHPSSAEINLGDTEGIGFYGQTPQEDGGSIIQGNGGDLTLRTGRAGHSEGAGVVHPEPEPERGSDDWWATRVNMPGAVFYLRKRVTTLPDARSALIRVLERRAETAPPTWAERIMDDDDED